MDYEHHAIDPFGLTLPPLVAEVLTYWDTKRRAAFAPSWSDFALDELPPGAVPWCSVLDVIPDPLDFVFRFWGTARRDIVGQEITGKRLSTITEVAIAKSTFDQNAMVVETGVPLFFDVTAYPAPDDEIRYGILRMPLSSDGQRVDKVFTISYNPAKRQALHRLFGTIPEFSARMAVRKRPA